MRRSLELLETLRPEPASVGRARRLIEGVLIAAGRAELVDAATLLASEVVTNSVLHAGTEMRLRCQPSGDGIRVELFDRSPLLPSMRHYDAEATTGRGLALVSALATSWGVDCDDDGKTVWFEIGTGDERGKVLPEVQRAAAHARAPEAVFVVHLLDASPALIEATIEQGDALLRELALSSLGGERDDTSPAGWRLPQFDVSPVLAAAEAAAASGHAKANLELNLPAGAEAVAIERLRLVDHADALAREGLLLSAPALPEVAVCRHWIYNQIAEQAAGFPARAWELPQQLKPVQSAAGLSAEELEYLERGTAATVVADDANRIIFVNEAAGALLGWVPEALTGQRLTVLIPPGLREAHLAGFSRLQVTGEPRLLGKTLQMSALRRDGSCVEVALIIDQLARRAGRRTFRAVLTPMVGAGTEH